MDRFSSLAVEVTPAMGRGMPRPYNLSDSIAQREEEYGRRDLG